MNKPKNKRNCTVKGILIFTHSIRLLPAESGTFRMAVAGEYKHLYYLNVKLI